MSNLRLIDANLNRAAEALRTIEDYARFACDDADAAQIAKTLRHELRTQVADRIGRAALLTERDIDGDVGRCTKVPAEIAARPAVDIVGAAFGRLAEALRSIGEFGKDEHAEAAAAAEGLRYRAYALEPRVRLRSRAIERFRAAGVYALISESLCPHGDWRSAASAVIAGGAGCVQLREKALSDRELLGRALWLREQTRAADVLLAVNDRPDIARLSGADLLHLGQDDLDVASARRIVGGQMLIGVSTHSEPQIREAVNARPDYLAVGPMFASATKPQAHIAGPQTIAIAREITTLPLVAIGGIDPTNLEAVLEAGADLVCVGAAAMGALDPRGAITELRAGLCTFRTKSKQQD